ncbi:MAG TPA: hypothetical protein PLS81_08230 [Deltaproteobacteria bacterium]|nr:hypothetical protein [Deltaproteobacteria bacterium]HOM29431.1 hypothetical protein [Deltaproteobacteria bacterium]HPP80990.1 hypothetical protein [Deltaproteobacteria bacterium]
MRKIVLFGTLCLILATAPATSMAASSSLEVVLVDSLWGAAIGTLAGAATLAFMDHPKDHTERIYQGAAVGLFLGMAFGVYELSPMFSSYERPDGTRVNVWGLACTVGLGPGPRPSRAGLWSW